MSLFTFRSSHPRIIQVERQETIQSYYAMKGNMNIQSPDTNIHTGLCFFTTQHRIKLTHHKLSRKKAQGRARKAANSIFIPKRPDPHGYQHFCYPEDASPKDVAICHILLSSFEHALSALLNSMDPVNEYEYHQKLSVLVLSESGKNGYDKLSRKGKSLFKWMNISLGTEAILLAPECIEHNLGVMPFAFMIKALELWDEPGDMSFDDSLDAMWLAMRDLMHCSRLTVRFFHRRNTCHCLQQTYYTLKETSNRTTHCCNCLMVKDIHDIKICDCDMAQYCSRACQLAQWDEHKDFCKAWRLKKRRLANSSCNEDK